MDEQASTASMPSPGGHQCVGVDVTEPRVGRVHVLQWPFLLLTLAASLEEDAS